MKQIAGFGLLLSVVFLSVPVQAGDVFHCAFGEQERVISVVYENAGDMVPCEVHYKTEEGVETPWSAENEEGFCEARAQEFVEQHRDWGWRCDLMPGNGSAPEPEER